MGPSSVSVCVLGSRSRALCFASKVMFLGFFVLDCKLGLRSGASDACSFFCSPIILVEVPVISPKAPCTHIVDT